MTDYMREVIYLTKIENGIPMDNAGYVKLEMRNQRLSLCLALKENSKKHLPVYLVHEKNGVLFPFYIGTTRGNDNWNMEMNTLLMRGVLMGSGEYYFTGNCKDYQPNISFERVQFVERQEVNAAEVVSDTLPEPEKEEANILREKLTEMYPFEDDEMEWCLQMTPMDFSYLPMEFWHYGKNSFLLQGFYNYRHLLYAHRKGTNYVGVPGQYHRKEQYLAGRFGFPRFKGTKKKTVTPGDFGYWLKEI